MRARLLSLVFAASLTACGSSPSSTDGPAPADGARADAANAVDARPADAAADAAAGSSLRLVVPATFQGATRQLYVFAATDWPLSGPPQAVLYQQAMPQLSPGQVMTLTLDTSGLSGQDYVAAVLYMVGGGQFTPMPGVDYEAHSPDRFTFAGSPIDLGQLELRLAQ